MPKPLKGTWLQKHDGYPRMGCGPQNKRYVHVLIAEGMLGRALRRDEHVHHKDGNTRNPHWTNLLVLDKTVHNAVSRRQYWYLKQKLNREEAAWKAFFDVTGETYASFEARRALEETSFDTTIM